MMKARAKWLTAMGGVVLILCSLLYGLMALSAKSAKSLIEDDKNIRRKAQRPLVIAHRGGAGLWPENTAYAFKRARELGVDVLEIDVHATSDGVLVVMHDSTVDRTTDGSGPINMLTLAQLKKLDAAFRWSPDGGRNFPLRGSGITVPTLEEVLKAFPDIRFNIEPKQVQPSLIKPLCEMIRQRAMTKKVMVGAFSAQVLGDFRAQCPEVATSASPPEVSDFLTMSATRTQQQRASPRPVMQALQVPERMLGRSVLTRELVEAAHALDIEVHAWTINDVEAMKRLIDMGVDGIITDYPDRLLALLKSDGGDAGR